MASIHKQIGNRIREIRQKQKLTLEELSEKVSLDWSFIARIETGKAVPSIQSLAKISQALNVAMKDLFTAYAFNQDDLLDRQTASLLSQLKTSDKSKLIQILKLILKPQ